MSPKARASRHSIDTCTVQFHSWKPFTGKTLDSDSNHPNPVVASTTTTTSLYGHTKRPCLSDRATSFSLSIIDAIDMSKLSLFDDDRPFSSASAAAANSKRDKIRWMARKRRRRGASRSVSGRSSDRSGTRNGGRCCSVGAVAATATATCSDFMVVAGGTDSSGELFLNGVGVGNGIGNGVVGGGGGSGCGGGEVNWSSDVSDARIPRRERGEGNGGAGGAGHGSGSGIGEREASGSGSGFVFDAQLSESGYGSEPGYRGDAEFGYGDEVEDEEEDHRFLFWGERFEDSNMERVGEKTFSEQKTHYRGRRSKRHDLKMVDSVR